MTAGIVSLLSLLLVGLLILEVGCDGVPGSRVRLDKCGVCGGDNTTCHIISGIFTRGNLPYGYNLVATVPAGACSINITEMFPTRNYLALRYSDGKYIINGNWALGFTQDYQGAGTVFRYHRAPSDNALASSKEYILGHGPTNSSIDIMLLKQQQNMGIMYEYTIPIQDADKHSTNQKERPSNSIEKPARPQLLLDVNDDKTPPPGDQVLADSPEFNPELRERYKNVYGQEFADYILSGSRPSNSAGYPSQDNTQSYQVKQQQSQLPRVLPLYRTQTDTQPYAINPVTGHRVRHGHHGRRVITEKQPPQFIPDTPDTNLYPYQAQSSSPSYAYPNSAPSYGYQAQNARQRSYVFNPGSQAQQYYPNLYDGGYYYRGTGDYYSSPLRGPVNDQISQNLGPSSHYINNVVDPDKDYQWRITGYSDCSRPCGGGVQTTIIVCAKVSSLAVVTDQNCDNDLKPPEQNLTCNNLPCPPSWEAEEWTTCSTSCGRGTQTRQVKCAQHVSDTVIVPVAASLCPVQRPHTVRTCNEDLPCVRWRVGNWSQCSVDCGRGQRTREVACVSADDRAIPENSCLLDKPISAELCDMGSCAKAWFFTHWSQQCSPTCGEGLQRRDVFCSADEERCRRLHKPPETRTCQNELPCGGKWFTGPWGQCSVTCGSGVILRDVVCMKKLGRIMAIVGDENCMEEERPQTEQLCNNLPCGSQWYMTDWTECSRTCDTGYQNREVKCLDERRLGSTTCPADTKPSANRPCNTIPCPKNPTGVQCTDQFKNCRLVVQARLCYYSYYKSICCLSCTGAEDHHQDHVS